MAFLKKEKPAFEGEPENPQLGQVTSPSVTLPPVPDYSAKIEQTEFATPYRCDICNISANRLDQLENHKKGARHLKTLKLLGLPVPGIKQVTL